MHLQPRLQLCDGLQSGIEGNLHAMRAVFPASVDWTHDDGVVEDDEQFRDDEEDDLGIAELTDDDRYTATNTGLGTNQ